MNPTQFLDLFTHPQIDALLQSFGEGLVVADCEGHVTYMNTQAEKILGKTLKTVQGNHINHCHRCPWKIEDLLKNQGESTSVHRNEVQMGNRWLSVTATAITGADGKGLGSAMIVADTTHHHKLEEKLRLQFDELQERQKRLELQIYLARQIQQSLLPDKNTEFPGLQTRIWNRQSQIIGGDFSFARSTSTGGWIIFGDVMGKGVFASQFVPLMLGYVADEIPRQQDPAILLTNLNERLYSFVNERFTLFVTLLAVRWDSASRSAFIASAGHPAPFQIRGKKIERNEQDSLPLGIVSPTTYQTLECRLAPGDQLLLFSDGLTEPPIGKTAKEGQKLFQDHIESLLNQSKDLFATLSSELEDQAARFQPRDDQTLIALIAQP